MKFMVALKLLLWDVNNVMTLKIYILVQNAVKDFISMMKKSVIDIKISLNNFNMVKKLFNFNRKLKNKK